MTVTDEATFTAEVEKYRHELRVHCYRMLGSYDDAEDLVQETFLRAWRRREDFEGRSSFRAWLYRIATNACIDDVRRPQRVLPHQLEPASFPTEAIPAREISEKWHVPVKYLEQILKTLKDAGIIESHLGVGGGYRLARPATLITTGEVVRLLDGRLAPIGCVSTYEYVPCEFEPSCGLKTLWARTRAAIAGVLGALPAVRQPPGLHRMGWARPVVGDPPPLRAHPAAVRPHTRATRGVLDELAGAHPDPV